MASANNPLLRSGACVTFCELAKRIDASVGFALNDQHALMNFGLNAFVMG